MIECTDGLVGAFQFQFLDEDLSSHPSLYFISVGTNLRSSLFSLPYGDQGIYMYKAIFRILGEFPVQPLMEDYDFILRARKFGKICISDACIRTSARRWLSKGVIGNTLFNQVR